MVPPMVPSFKTLNIRLHAPQRRHSDLPVNLYTLQSSLTIFLTALFLIASGLPQRSLLIHAGITVLLPYIHTRIRTHALSHAWPDAPSNDRKRRAWELLVRLEALHSTLGLIGFITFLYDGRYNEQHPSTVPSRIWLLTV